jgi:hypothetical protein
MILSNTLLQQFKAEDPVLNLNVFTHAHLTSKLSPSSINRTYFNKFQENLLPNSGSHIAGPSYESFEQR